MTPAFSKANFFTIKRDYIHRVRMHVKNVGSQLCFIFKFWMISKQIY